MGIFIKKHIDYGNFNYYKHQIMSNKTPKINQRSQLTSTDSAVVQSMKIASVILKDILEQLYTIQNVQVEWGRLDDKGTPAFQYSFPETDENLQYASEFVEDFKRVKAAATRSIDPEQKTIAFYGLEGISIVIKEFLIQNNFCLLYTSPSPRDQRGSRMPSSA